MKMIKFPSIEQFRTIVKNVKDFTAYEGKDAEGNTVYNYSKEQPKITFKGTVKLHGTNAGVTCDLATGEFYAQSRENIITPEKDNAGFATFVYANKEYFSTIFEAIAIDSEISEDNYLSVYGEWAGKGIQKGVGISEIDKSFFIFGAKVTPKDEEKKAYWVDHTVLMTIPRQDRFYVIEEFETFSIEIDFNDPQRVQNDLIELTMKVEEECPVAKAFEIAGIGEGIVWSAELTPGEVVRFKVKGEKHSTSKVKKLASVDVEKLNSIRDFVDYAVTENRLNQGIEQVFTTKSESPDVTRTGEFVKWVTSDIAKEELDTLVENGLEFKDVMGQCSKKAASWFKTYLDKNL
jgi:hypothetical protein